MKTCLNRQVSDYMRHQLQQQQHDPATEEDFRMTWDAACMVLSPEKILYKFSICLLIQ